MPRSGLSAEKQPRVEWYRRFPRDGPSLFFTACSGHLCADASPEAGSARVLLLEGNRPPPRMQAHHPDGGLMANALPACCPDNEEIAHDLEFPGNAVDEREARSL